MVVKLTVGGNVPVFRAKMVKMASTAPAAPSKWPVAPLVEDILTSRACFLNETTLCAVALEV